MMQYLTKVQGQNTSKDDLSKKVKFFIWDGKKQLLMEI